jgi:hypothetical protein
MPPLKQGLEAQSSMSAHPSATVPSRVTQEGMATTEGDESALLRYPSPLNPSLHSQVYPPFELVHVADGSQTALFAAAVSSLKHSFKSFSQFTPAYPESHMQENASSASMQTPPFLHGESQQSSRPIWTVHIAKQLSLEQSALASTFWGSLKS